jgi:tripartite-type tricarboxylate transporter receptor subunit TctC
MMKRALVAAGLTAIVAIGACSKDTRAAPAEEFYRGSTLRLLSSSGASSGYTLWARFIARHLPRHIPGEPTVVVQSMVGAGGLLLSNYMYNVAPKDGREIATVPREAPTLPMMNTAGVRYDSQKFNWLGTPTSETNLCVTSRDAAFQSVDDLYKKQLIVGTTGVGSGMHIFPVALNALLGMKFKTIEGYKDTGVILLALDRNEIQGACQSAETLMQARGDDIRSGKIRIMLQAGAKPDPDFPNVPFVLDLAKTEEERQALRFLYSSLTFGRPYLAPPDVPADRVAILRKAFAETFKDPAFLAEAKVQKYEVSPISGEEMAALIQELGRTPKPVIDRVSALIEPPKPN